jgi:hypothetical protein
MHAAAAALLLDILEAAIDDRIYLIELALDLARRRVSAAGPAAAIPRTAIAASLAAIAARAPLVGAPRTFVAIAPLWAIVT